MWKTILIVLIVIAMISMHIFIAMYVDKLNSLEGKGKNNWALIPFTNVYLLGAKAVHFVLGIILFIGLFFVVPLDFSIFGLSDYTILGDNLRHILFVFYIFVILAVMLIAIHKYDKMTNYNDKFDRNDLIYYLREVFWIIVLGLVIYFFMRYIDKFDV